MGKRVLIFYTAVGMGHKSNAENIGASLERSGFQVKLADAYKAQDGALVQIGTIIHRFMNVQAPWLWRFFYTNKLFTDLSLRFRTKVAAKNYRRILDIIQAYNPDIVISTQAAPSGVVTYLKKQKLYQGSFGIAFSDFHLHRYWLYDEADFYLVNIEAQKQEMVKLGVPAEKIFVTGFNVQPHSAVDTESVKAKFGIKPGVKVVLVGSGSLGIGFNKKLIRQLAKRDHWHTIVVCGNNRELCDELTAEFKVPNVSILGFYSPMEELYAIADIFLTKPGGLSTAEALRFGLPMIITSILPGQEEWNLHYLREANLIMPEEKDVIGQVESELASGAFRASLETNPHLKKLFEVPSAGEIVKDLV